jgi:D-sedoheptulose 7-phosphate isomerase
MATRTEIPVEVYRPRFEPRRIATAHLRALEALLQGVDLDAVERVVNRLRLARDGGATIYVAGNGGSASTASHWVNDLCKATRGSGQPPVRALSLSDNASWVTALANDEGYERIFAGQLENFARHGDLLVVISASGNSPNLVEAVEVAHERDLATIGLLGFDGGTLMDKVTDCLWLPTEAGAYEVVESGHAVLCHVLSLCLAQDLAGTANGR